MKTSFMFSKFKCPTSKTTNDFQKATTSDSDLENAEVNVYWKYF